MKAGIESTAAIAESFSHLDFHDDTFACMRVLPPQSRGVNAGATIEIELLHYSEQKKQVLRFLGCANLRVGVDFDVLAHNSPPNTSRVEAHTNRDAMWSLMQSQTRDWGVEYAPDMTNPMDRKLAVMDELVCFRVQLFGGVIEIIARRYEVERSDRG